MWVCAELLKCIILFILNNSSVKCTQILILNRGLRVMRRLAQEYTINKLFALNPGSMTPVLHSKLLNCAVRLPASRTEELTWRFCDLGSKHKGKNIYC